MRPLHANVVVRRYTKPAELDSGLALPDAYLGDRTQTLWEVVDAGPCAEYPCEYCRAREKDIEELGERPFRGLLFQLLPDDIVMLRHGWAAVSLEHVLNEDVWMLHARHIASITRWKEPEDGRPTDCGGGDDDSGDSGLRIVAGSGSLHSPDRGEATDRGDGSAP